MDATQHSPTEGVWVTPAGTRVEILREGAVWRAYPYLTLRGGEAGPVAEYDTEQDVRRAVAGLQAIGHQWVPNAPEGPTGPGDRMARNMIGFALLVLVLVVGIALVA